MALKDTFESGYSAGFMAGVQFMTERNQEGLPLNVPSYQFDKGASMAFPDLKTLRKPKRKLSAWNKFVKANSKKPRFKYKSGANKGKLNLKAMAVAFRRTPAGKKSKK